MEQGVGSGHRWSTLFPGPAPPPFPSVHQLESFESLSSWIFMDASLCRKDWLDHWPLETVLDLQPLSSPGAIQGGAHPQGEGTRSSSPRVIQLAVLAISPHL